jgi:hypothetical protein
LQQSDEVLDVALAAQVLLVVAARGLLHLVLHAADERFGLAEVVAQNAEQAVEVVAGRRRSGELPAAGHGAPPAMDVSIGTPSRALRSSGAAASRSASVLGAPGP